MLLGSSLEPFWAVSAPLLLGKVFWSTRAGTGWATDASIAAVCILRYNSTNTAQTAERTNTLWAIQRTWEGFPVFSAGPGAGKVLARLTRCSEPPGDRAHQAFFEKINFKQLLWSFTSHVSKTGHFGAGAVKPITCSHQKGGTGSSSLGTASTAKSFCHRQSLLPLHSVFFKSGDYRVVLGDNSNNYWNAHQEKLMITVKQVLSHKGSVWVQHEKGSYPWPI